MLVIGFLEFGLSCVQYYWPIYWSGRFGTVWGFMFFGVGCFGVWLWFLFYLVSFSIFLKLSKPFKSLWFYCWDFSVVIWWWV